MDKMKHEKALDWFLKQELDLTRGDRRRATGKATVMKWVEGDPENRCNLKAKDIAYFIAKYHSEQATA